MTENAILLCPTYSVSNNQYLSFCLQLKVWGNYKHLTEIQMINLTNNLTLYLKHVTQLKALNVNHNTIN